MKLPTVSDIAGLAKWKLILGGVVVGVSLLAGWFHVHDSNQQDIGAQVVRDSLASVVAVRLHHRVDDTKQAAADSLRAARSFADSVTRASQSFARRQADLARHPLRVATVQGDTIQIPPDTTHFIVAHPVAAWIYDASATVAKQDSAIRDASVIVSSIPTMQEKYEAALRTKDTATFYAVQSAYADGVIAGKKQARAEPKPASKYQMVLHIGELAGVAYLGYRIGHR